MSADLVSPEPREVAPPRRPRWGPWATSAFGLLAIVLTGAGQTLGVFLYVLWQNSEHPERPVRIADLPGNGPALATAFAVSAPLVIGFIALVVKWSGEDFRDHLGLRPPTLRDGLIGAAAIAGVLALAGLVASLIGLEPPSFAGDTFGSAARTGFLPLYVLAFAVLAPLQEELLFRGLLYRGYAAAIGPPATIVLLSAAWAVFHVQYKWFFVGEIFALGLVLGWLRWRSGSLVLTVVLHMAVNGLAMLAAAFGA